MPNDDYWAENIHLAHFVDIWSFPTNVVCYVLFFLQCDNGSVFVCRIFCANDKRDSAWRTMLGGKQSLARSSSHRAVAAACRCRRDMCEAMCETIDLFVCASSIEHGHMGFDFVQFVGIHEVRSFSSLKSTVMMKCMIYILLFSSDFPSPNRSIIIFGDPLISRTVRLSVFFEA